MEETLTIQIPDRQPDFIVPWPDSSQIERFWVKEEVCATFKDNHDMDEWTSFIKGDNDQFYYISGLDDCQLDFQPEMNDRIVVAYNEWLCAVELEKALDL